MLGPLSIGELYAEVGVWKGELMMLEGTDGLK